MTYAYYVHHSGYAEHFDFNMPCASHNDVINEFLDRGVVNHHMEPNGSTLRTLCKMFDWSGKGPMRSNNDPPNCRSCRAVLRYTRPNRCECWEGDDFVWNRYYCLYHRNLSYRFSDGYVPPQVNYIPGVSSNNFIAQATAAAAMGFVGHQEILVEVDSIDREILNDLASADPEMNRFAGLLYNNNEFQQRPPPRTPSEAEQIMLGELKYLRNQSVSLVAEKIRLTDEISTLKKYIKDKGLLLPGETAEEPEDMAVARFKLLEID